LENFLAKNEEFNNTYVAQKPALFSEDPDLLSTTEHPELAPYRNLDAKRLKLVGNGAWPMEKFLEGPLWLPFQEPRFLLHGEDVSHFAFPSFVHEDEDENLELCRLWDARGLLRFFKSPIMPGHYSRVFNAYKNQEVDRQIGDRRIPNARERSVDGPSAYLPPGFLLCNLRVRPFQEQLFASVTDRRDYYHQASVTPERARSNMLPFAFAESRLVDFKAAETFKKSGASASRRRKPQEQTGDRFGFLPPAPEEPGCWYAAFGSLFQGDHLGVEFALQAHEALLQSHGLLVAERRLQGHQIFPVGNEIEGLIIDDFFAIGKERLDSQPISSFAAKALAAAREAYEFHRLPGSPEKDVEAETFFKAAGAEVDSSSFAVRRGLTTVAAPLSKRLGLSVLSLRAARLASTSSRLLSRLAGNWTSVLMFKRCLMATVDEMFALAAEAEKIGKNYVIHQSPAVRTELIMLGALAPIISTNIATSMCPYVFASDASLGKGAVVCTSVEEKVAEAMWVGADKKGSYSKLDSFPCDLLAAAGEELSGDVEACEFVVEPKRPLLMYYDFVEFFGGSGRVSQAAYRLGLCVAPPLDLDASCHYDMTQPRLLEWAFHMIESGRFRSFLTEPPCTTFSAAAYPALRSYKEPFGFDPSEPRTEHGNLLAFRSFPLLRHGRRHRRPRGKEQPRRSKMAWLPQWLRLLEIGFEESVIASCQFGSPHRKEFLLLSYALDSQSLEVRCPGGHDHVKIEGSYTKASAVYTHELAHHLALHFKKALRCCGAIDDEPPVTGYESAVVNDVLISRQFRVRRCWAWRRKSHINVLEARSALEIIREASTRFESHRVNGLLDSRVAKGALAKGRSTSFGLQRVCKMSAALQTAADVQMAWNFAPTRLNVADDPTRDCLVRPPCGFGLSGFLDVRELQLLHASSLSKVAANWVRLVAVLLLSNFVGVEAFEFRPGFESTHEVMTDCASPFCHVPFEIGQGSLSGWFQAALDLVLWIFGTAAFQFRAWVLDEVFGFLPWNFGTAPYLSIPLHAHWIFCSFLAGLWTFLWTFLCSMPSYLPSVSLSFGLLTGFLLSPCLFRVWKVGRCAGFWSVLCLLAVAPERWIWVGPVGASAMEPSSAADIRRAGYRDPQGILPTRVARKATLDARTKLLNEFGTWLFESQGVLLTPLLTAKPADPEEICKHLIQYGQQMFLAGRAYGKFAETINAIATFRPALRKQLSPAWDLAFAWLADEPFQHHPALPLSILLAMLATAILWGWPYEACVLALTWTGILRIGETIMATRGDLILPSDAAPGTTFALLRIRMPKTRGRAARHQAARVDPPDIVSLLQATYADFPSEKKLWPLSATTLRKRFTCLLRELGLPSVRQDGLRPFDLGSLRPGGATHLLLATDNIDLVRRRGRWVTIKVCEIYLQEVMYVTYTEKLQKGVRDRIQTLASAFPRVLQVAISYLHAGLPPSVWNISFKAQDNQEHGAHGVNGRSCSSSCKQNCKAADGNQNDAVNKRGVCNLTSSASADVRSAAQAPTPAAQSRPDRLSGFG